MAKPNNENSENKKSNRNAWKKFWRIIYSLFCVGVIISCVVGCIMTVAIFKFVDGESDIDLTSLKLNYTTILYSQDAKTDKPYELQRIHGDENRIWTDIDTIPKHMIDATIAAEDKRFLTHNGVDWKRTIAATIDHFTKILGGNSGGGSTIEQQLIKNVQQHYKRTISAKIQEIFGAVKLDKSFTKEQVIEAYLNTIPFGQHTNGVQAAANLYFNKDVSELTLPESAAIITLTNNPTRYNLYTKEGRELNSKRREYIYKNLLEGNKIDQKQYDELIKTDVVPVEKKENTSLINSWPVDYVLSKVSTDLAAKEGITVEEAYHKINYGGYKIYTTINPDLQKELERKYSIPETFPKVYQKEYPETSAMIMSKNGAILGMMGGNKKEGNLVFNRATEAVRPMGSTMKPISPYLQAMEMDLINWSTVFEDEPIDITMSDGSERKWPVNNDNIYRGPVTVQYALEISLNTIPAQLIETIGTQIPYDFLVYKLGFENFIEGNDNNSRSAMAVGGTAGGATLQEMVGSYQMFASNGMYVKPYIYTRVEDSRGNIILENDTQPIRVISPETATVMNKLLQLVASQGSGRGAYLPSVPMGGKTGTSSGQKDLWFIGFTPDYVAGVWMGFDKQDSMTYPWYPPPRFWKSVFGDYLVSHAHSEFAVNDNVIPLKYCLQSGELATDECQKTSIGWYKKSNIPDDCSIHGGSSINDNENQDEQNSQDEQKSTNTKHNRKDKKDKDNNDKDQDTGFKFPWQR